MILIPESVHVSTKLLVSLFRDLQEWTVSLDRIGSRIASGEDPGILLRYVADAGVARRLARHRGDIADILDEFLGADAAEAIAEDVWVYGDPGEPGQ